MTRRSFLLLCVLAAVLALIAVLAAPSGKRQQGVAGGAILEGLDLNGLTQLSISDAENTVDLSRSGADWQVAAFPDLPVDQAKVRRLLLSLTRLTIEEAKTDDPALHSAIGLAATATTIKMGESGLLLGKPAASGGRFARRLDEDQSYVVSDISPPQTSLKDWVDIDLPTIPAETVTRVDVIRGEERYSVVKGDGGALALAGLQDGEALAYETVLETVIGGAVYIDFTDIRPVSEVSWAGVPYSVFTGAQDSDQIRYTVAEEDGSFWLRIAPEGTLVPEGDLDWPAYAFAISDYRRDTLVKPRSELLEEVATP